MMGKKENKFLTSFFKSKKTGELTTHQIVIIVILIVSFIIILFLLFRLNLKETSIKEICHNSVVMKGGSALPSEMVSLNCQTTYLCISKTKNCEKMTKPIIKTVKIPDEVYKILADEIYDCWWMFGEGKISYVAEKEFFGKNYCSICAQVGFDESLKDIFPDDGIDKKELYRYMYENKITKKKITYLEYLYSSNDYYTKLKPDAKIEKIDLDKFYYVMMGVKSKTSLTKWGLIGGAGAGTLTGFFYAGPLGAIIGALTGAGTGAGGGAAADYLFGVIVRGASGDEYLSPTIVEFDSNDFNELECSSIKTLA